MTTSETPRPKPGPPKKAPVVAEVPKEKPKYIRKPHLTDKPFQAHSGLQQLQKEMANLTPKRGQRRTNKEKK